MVWIERRWWSMAKQRYCKVCRCITTNANGYCDAHQPKPRERSKESDRRYNEQRPERHKFYHSKDWKALRRIKVAKNPVCERCLERGVITPTQIVHHKITIEEDYSKRLDLDNLESLCRRCHNEEHSPKLKQARELSEVVAKYRRNT